MATQQLPPNFDLAQRGEEHFKNLVLELNNDVSKLPEVVFKSVFLPIFNGTRVLTDTDEILKSWVGIAGAPGKEVEIIDNSGNALFRVPPIFDSSFIDSGNANGGKQLSQIMSAYDLHRSVLPVVGENFLTKEIPQRVESLANDITPNKINEQRWQEIFDRYDETVKDKNTSTAAKPGDVGDDDMVF